MPGVTTPTRRPRLPIPTSYSVPDEFTSPKWARAFAAGCSGRVSEADDLQPGSVALFGSPKRWQLFQTAILQHRQYFYGDHAYFRRGNYYRITKDRLQHTGIPSPHRPPPSLDRMRAAGVSIAPEWRTAGSHIVICPNSPVYMALFGIDAHYWAVNIINQLSTLTDRPVILRWKSQAGRRPLYVDLVDAWCVVVFSSNAAVEAVAAGIPCITLAPFAAAARMGRTRLADVENLAYPDDRETFLATLADNQWTMEEIQRGDAWRALQHE